MCNPLNLRHVLKICLFATAAVLIVGYNYLTRFRGDEPNHNGRTRQCLDLVEKANVDLTWVCSTSFMPKDRFPVPLELRLEG